MTSDDSLEQALAGGAPQLVGWFRFHFADERWEWSDEVQLLHGYQPGTVTPTTELVLSQCELTALPAAVGDRVDALWNVGGVLHEGDRGPERSLQCANQT